MSINVSAMVASLRSWVPLARQEPLAWQLCQTVAVGLREQHGWSSAMIADLLGCSCEQAARFVQDGAERERAYQRRGH